MKIRAFAKKPFGQIGHPEVTHLALTGHQKRTEVTLSFPGITPDPDCTPSFRGILTRIISLPVSIQTKMIPVQEKIIVKIIKIY